MLLSYLKLALRVFARRKFFTIISLFGVALTLVVLVVATALLEHTFGPLSPESRLDRCLGVYIVELRQGSSHGKGPAGYRLLSETAKSVASAERVSVFSVPAEVASYPNGERVTSFLKHTDGEFFAIYDFDFIEGGPLTVDDEKNANPVAVINEATRTKFFGQEPALGKMLEADGQRFRVVGVVRDVQILRILPFSDIWVPISTSKSDGYKQGLMGAFMATMLARESRDLDAIRLELDERVRSVVLPEGAELKVAAQTPFQAFSGVLLGLSPGSGGAAMIAILVALAVAFMLLPALNLVNLNVSRILERAPEIGVRKAFGASRATLVTQFVVENVLLCLVGGAAGLAGALIVLALVERSGFIPYARFSLDIRIFTAGVVAATFFGVLSGVYPAWKMSRLRPAFALKRSSR